MAHDMSGAATALMIALMIAMMVVMMAAMGGLSLAVIARKAPASWLARITRPARKPAGPAATSSRGDPR